MNQNVIVRKPLTHRICFRIFTIVFVIILSAVVFMREFLLLLVLGPIALAFGIATVYMETWQIRFSKKDIQKYIFNRAVCGYSYAQMTSAEIAYSYTEHEYVELAFETNQYLRFRLKDENAVRAVKVICSHRSIRQKGL